MSSVKYYFDPETLSYRQVTANKTTKLKYFVGFVLLSGLFGFLIVFAGSYYFESPNEKALKRELQNMEFQYTILNQKMIEIEVSHG